MFESSFLCFSNGVCILIFNLLLSKTVYKHWPNLAIKDSRIWKGSLEKALQVIYSALAGFTFGLKSDNFPPDLQHSKAHPLYDSSRAKELAGCRSECYKADVISGLLQGWEVEYSSLITVSEVGYEIAVL